MRVIFERLMVRTTHPLRAAPRPVSQSRQGSLRAKPSQTFFLDKMRYFPPTKSERSFTIYHKNDYEQKKIFTRIWRFQHQLEVTFKERSCGKKKKVLRKLKMINLMCAASTKMHAFASTCIIFVALV